MKLKRLYLALALNLLSAQAFAQNINSLSLPQAPVFQGGQDRVRSADGTECAMSVGPREKYADFGVVVSSQSGQGVDNAYAPYYPGLSTPAAIYGQNNFSRGGVSVYGRIVINLDRDTNPKIDCNRVLDLEIIRLRTELQQSQLQGVVAKPSGGK